MQSIVIRKTPNRCQRSTHFIRRRSFLFLGFVLFATLSIPALLSAQTLYIQPTAEIPLRRGQGSQYAIIAVVKDGSSVQLLEESDDWARVLLDNGKDGWLLRRYLSTQRPPNQQVDILSRENVLLTEKNVLLEKQLQELSDLNGRTEQELSACLAARTDIRDELESLQNDTVDVQRTKKSLAEASVEIAQLHNQLTDLQIENTVLKKNESIKWFLVGTGVLLSGWLLGRFTKSNKKRRSSLL